MEEFKAAFKNLRDAFIAFWNELKVVLEVEEEEKEPSAEETVVAVDGKHYMLSTNEAPNTTTVFNVYYTDSCSVVSTKELDIVNCFQSDEGFFVECFSFLDEAEEVPMSCGVEER